MTVAAQAGDCPVWCELPRGHTWDDEWTRGLVRFRKWRRQVSSDHAIELREIEQYVEGVGAIRTREIVLDVESPTQWDVPTAKTGLALLAEAVAMAQTRPSGLVPASEIHRGRGD